jgi:hypothetical protein
MTRILLISCLLAWSLPARAADKDDAKDTAWSRSVAAEVAGDLPRAEAILLESWDEQTDNYYVQLRRAYLSLLQGQFALAKSRYAALAATSEGKDDPDVAAGLAAATEGKRPNAAPLDRATPELWTGFVSQGLGGPRYQGGAIFAHLPLRLTPALRLHAAGRYVLYQRQGAGSPWAFSSTGPRRLTIADALLGLDYQQPWWGVDALAVYEKTSTINAIMGGGLRGRVGETYGLILETAALMAQGRTTNWQLTPLAFLWPTPTIGLRAGARMTRDGTTSVSAILGVSLLFKTLSLHMDGHLGDERAALTMPAFSLLDLPGTATLGGTATLSLRVHDRVRLYLQTQGERLKRTGAEGSYFSASLGIDVSLHSP